MWKPISMAASTLHETPKRTYSGGSRARRSGGRRSSRGANIDMAMVCANDSARMARRTRRELDIADHLWDCLTRIAEDCGTDRHAVVNQAVYEFARRFNFLTPMAKEVPPLEHQVGPGRANGVPHDPVGARSCPTSSRSISRARRSTWSTARATCTRSTRIRSSLAAAEPATW